MLEAGVVSTPSTEGSLGQGRFWGWIQCASAILSQPLAFHTCAGGPVAPVPYWCALGASVCRFLAVMTDSLEECIARLKAWKEGMKHRGHRVNMKKTKIMASGPVLDLLCDSDVFACAVCQSGVGVNSIQCSKCRLLVHKKCSGVRGRQRKIC